MPAEQQNNNNNNNNRMLIKVKGKNYTIFLPSALSDKKWQSLGSNVCSPGGEEGVLPYMGYIGMCGPRG